MIATSGFVAPIECAKFVFSRGYAPDPLKELTALPWPHLREPYFSGEGRVWEGKEIDRGGGRRKGRKGKWKHPLRQFLPMPLSHYSDCVSYTTSGLFPYSVTLDNRFWSPQHFTVESLVCRLGWPALEAVCRPAHGAFWCRSTASPSLHARLAFQ